MKIRSLSKIVYACLALGLALPVGASAQESGGEAQQNASGSGLTLIESRSPGSYVATAAGMSLYTLVDENMQPLPCEGECLESWPAYTGEAALAEAGIALDANLIGTTQMQDGSTQVTYNDHPLYTFAGDEGDPGRTQGQGVQGFGGTWYLLDDTGQPLESDPNAP